MSKKLLMNNGGIDKRLKARYTTKYNDIELPTFNSDFVYEVNIIDNGDGTYTREIYSDDDFTSVKFDLNTYPTSIDYLAITNKVTDMKNTFNGANILEYINATNWDTSNVTTLNACFSNCNKLTEIKGIENLNVHKVTELINTFSNCRSLKSLDLSKWYIDGIKYFYMAFYRCSALESLKVFNCDITNSSIMMNVFYNCESLTTLDLTPWRVGTPGNYKPTFSFNSCFANCRKLTEIKGIENWNFTVDKMNSMFQDCSSLTSLDLSNLDTSKLTNLEYTFSNCTSLTSLDLSSWDVRCVNNMYYTFFNCPYLTTLEADISNWDTRNVTNMGGLFAYCTSLELSYLNNWDTSNVTNMSEMFAGRWNQSISDLYIENWNTSNVTNMSTMFYGCSNGWYDLHLNWDTSNVTNMSEMFNGFNGVQYIYINNWDTSNLSDASNMFLECQASSIYVSPDFQYTEEDTGYSSGYFIREY